MLCLIKATPCVSHLCAALGDAEAGHDLIKAQQGALGLGHLTQALRRGAKNM